MDNVMTLMFTDFQCKQIVDAIEESGTDKDELVMLAAAMKPNALKQKRGAFMAYVREGDDEILPGFRLTDHAIRVSPAEGGWKIEEIGNG